MSEIVSTGLWLTTLHKLVKASHSLFTPPRARHSEVFTPGVTVWDAISARGAWRSGKKALGQENSDLVWSYDLAKLYARQRPIREGQALYKRAWAIQKKTLTRSTPDLAWSLNGLAKLHATQGHLRLPTASICSAACRIQGPSASGSRFPGLLIYKGPGSRIGLQYQDGASRIAQDMLRVRATG